MPTRNAMTRDELLAFLDEMTEAERRTFDEMRAALKQTVKDLNWYLAFGRGVLRLRGARGAARRHGWMRGLARALGCSPSLLNKTRDFASQYEPREVKALAQKGITWGMVYPTFPVEDKEVQKAWMARARDEDWNVHELEKEIQRARQGPQRKGGRPRRRLKSYGPAVDLQNLSRTTGEWLRNHRDVWAAEGTGLLDQLAALSPADCSVTLGDQLSEAELALEELVRAASALKERLYAFRKKVNRALGTSGV